jgi:hypothetical protein
VVRLKVESARSDMENQAITVVNNVKSAYYNVLRAKRRREITVNEARPETENRPRRDNNRCSFNR